MANPHKGEVAFSANGKAYTMSYSGEALSDLEDMLDMSAAEIGETMSDPKRFRFKMLRSLFLAGLRDHHPDIEETEVRSILRSMTGNAAIELFSKAMSSEPIPPQESAPTEPTGAGS